MAILLVLLGLLIQDGALRNTASVEGVVADHVGQPVEGVSLSLLAEGTGPSRALTARTDGSGRFRFPAVPPGRYRLVPGENGYLLKTVRVGRAESSTTLNLSAGAKIERVRLQLIRSLQISGRVTDEEGRPLASAVVRAVRVSYRGSSRLLRPCFVPQNARTLTDDNGRYAIRDLEPGNYYLSVVQAALLPETESPNNVCGTWYYPGVTDPANATPIKLPSGTDLHGLELKVWPMETHTASFKVVSKNRDLPPRRPRVSIVRMSSNGLRSVEYFGGVGVLRENTYTTPPLSRGNYEITYDYGFGGASSADAAKQEFQIVGRNISGSDLILIPPTELRGIVRVDAPPPVGWSVDNLSIGLLPLDVDDRITYVIGHAVGKDGRFLLPSVSLGRYGYYVTGLKDDLYLASAKTGDRDVLDAGLVVDGDSMGPLELTVRSGGGVQGVVRDAIGDVVPDAVVALMPETNRRNNSFLFRSSLTDQKGEFLLRGVAPGSYSLFALEVADVREARTREFLEQIEIYGTRVRVTSGNATSVVLRVGTAGAR